MKKCRPPGLETLRRFSAIFGVDVRPASAFALQGVSQRCYAISHRLIGAPDREEAGRERILYRGRRDRGRRSSKTSSPATSRQKYQARSRHNFEFPRSGCHGLPILQYRDGEQFDLLPQLRREYRYWRAAAAVPAQRVACLKLLPVRSLTSLLFRRLCFGDGSHITAVRLSDSTLGSPSFWELRHSRCI